MSLGRVTGIFGIRGEVKIAATSVGADAIGAGLEVTLRFQGKEARRATVAHARAHKRVLVTRFAQIDSADAAQELVGGVVWTARESAQLAEGEYFDDDLVGCRLVDGEHDVGAIRAVLHYPAQDVLELESGALVPLVSAFVREIDVAARIVRVELPPGLVDGEAL